MWILVEATNRNNKNECFVSIMSAQTESEETKVVNVIVRWITVWVNDYCEVVENGEVTCGNMYEDIRSLRLLPSCCCSTRSASATHFFFIITFFSLCKTFFFSCVEIFGLNWLSSIRLIQFFILLAWIIWYVFR